MNSCANKLRKCLEESKGERKTHAYLKQHPGILHKAFVPTFMASRVVSEFVLGSQQLRADFVVLAPYSGAWEIHLVELEPVNELLFNQDGTPRKRLKGAINQIDRWRTFAEKRLMFLAEQLSNACRDRDLVHPEWRSTDPTCTAGLKMTDPHSSLDFAYHIIIGRRNFLFGKRFELKTSYQSNHGIDIASYDRLVEAASAVDEDEKKYG